MEPIIIALQKHTDIQIAGEYEYTVSDNKATITNYLGNSSIVTIPETLGGFDVVAIGECACYGNTSLTSVILPNTKKILLIDRYAFSNCPNLKSIILSGVTTIKDGAFMYCTNLELSEESVRNVKSIGLGVFKGCSSIEEAYLPNVVTIGQCSDNEEGALRLINNGVFYGCSSLKKVTAPNLLDLGDCTFSYCSSLEELHLDKIEHVGNKAFGFGEFTIHAPYYSNAREVANTNGIKFIAEKVGEIIDISHEILGNAIKFTVKTTPGAYNRLKVTAASSPKSYIVHKDLYSIDENGEKVPNFLEDTDGNYVWELEIENTGILSTTKYLFDLRSAETNTYLHLYNNYSIANYRIAPSYSISHEIIGGKIVFNVVTGPGDYNRLKITTEENSSGSYGVSDIPEITDSNNLAWTIQCNNNMGLADYVLNNFIFDVRSSEDGKFTKLYSDLYKVEIVDISHVKANGNATFKIVTEDNSKFNCIKFASANSLENPIAITETYSPKTLTVKDDSEIAIREWTMTVPETDLVNTISELSDFIFTVGNIAEDGTCTYSTQQCHYSLVARQTISSISHYYTKDNKIVFSVTTPQDLYNRLKLMNAGNLTNYIAYSDLYIKNTDGECIWSVSTLVPTENTSYAFDLRLTSTGKYLKDYYEYEVLLPKAIKSVEYEIQEYEMQDKVVITVVTSSGLNRVKITETDNLSGYLNYTSINSSRYEETGDGNCKWTLVIDIPEEPTIYAFDVRSIDTGAYLEDYLYYEIDPNN